MFRKSATTEGRFGIYDADTFLEIIRYEKNRADRDKLPVSVVVFDVPQRSGSRRLQRHLVDQLRTSVRLVDHIGWVETGDVGVLLPSTSRRGAQKFVDAFQRRMPDVHSCIYSYNSEQTSEPTAESKRGLGARFFAEAQ